MSGRIRRPSASTSASTPRGQSNRHRITDDSPRSGSGTPMFEDDEEGLRKRSTRGRNPLPPTSGPLFPPLPPKLPKSRMSGNSFGSMLDPPLETSPTPSEKPDLPNGSNASLTPPPPGSEDVLLDDEEEDQQNGNEGQEMPVEQGEDQNQGVEPKIEVEEAEDEASKLEERIQNGSERAGSQSRAKRRRGEEALLLDDHLLPPEIRHITQKSTSRRSSNAKVDQEEEKRKEEAVAEDVQMDDAAVEGEEEIGDVENGDEQENDWEEEGQDVTRCVCQTEDPDDVSMMIQCDQCNVWQHGPCMGIWGDEDAPDEYFCELCRPDLHGPLKRWIRRCGRDPAMFVPPTYDDLRKMRPHNDRSAPSQSKLFTDPTRMSSPPPPAPAKPASRSHHKKEIDPPAGPVQDGRRSGRRLPFPDRPSSKGRESVPPVKPPVLAKRRSSVGQVDSVSPNRSMSPSAHMHSAARRRITMNSRDAMYEEEVKAAMEASRREALGLSPAAEIVSEPVEEEQVEKHEVKKGKRKRDEEDPNAADIANGKTKHPNQYTYRPKPPSSSQPATAAAPSPARRGAAGGGGTPAPPSIAPPQHEHGTRRAGAIAHGAIAYPNLSATSVANLNWYLPDYLTPYSDLLPTPQPVALDVRSQRTLPHISRNHHLNQRYGPFNEERDEEGRLVLPDENPMREPTGEAETHLEPPARIKYPARRITVGEIRKRVRSMLDYVSKAQSMEEKRLERNRALGIVVTRLPKKKGKGKETGDSGMDIDETEGVEGDLEDTQMDLDDLDQDDSSPPARTSIELMEELTRDLLAFQETYTMGNGVTPLPPPIPNFEPPLPVPELPVDSAHDTELGRETEAELETEPAGDEQVSATEVEKEKEVEQTEEREQEHQTGLSESVMVDEPQLVQEPTSTVEATHNDKIVTGLGITQTDSTGLIEPLKVDTPGPVQEPTTSVEAVHDNERAGLEATQTASTEKEREATDRVNDIPASSFEIPILNPTTVPAADPISELDPQTNFNPTDELPQPTDSNEMTIEQASVDQTTDVYREGQVDKIMISGQEERNVVDSLDEVTASVTATETGVQVVEPVV